jgi:predicted ATPase
MNTTLKIKNFRVFDENGVSLDMKPITILTGSNSSGKSSVTKAVILLNSFLAQIKKAVDNGDPIRPDDYKIDFTQYPNNLLGRFDRVVNENSKSKKISIGYTVYSYMLSKDVDVVLVFSADENTELYNAYLDSITMSTEDGVFYFSSNSEPSYCNLNILKEDYVTFLLIEREEYRQLKYEGAGVSFDDMAEFYGFRKSGSSFEVTGDETAFRDSVDKSRREDIEQYVKRAGVKEPILNKKDSKSSFLEIFFANVAKKKDSLFNIPILNELSKLDKKDVRDFVNSKCVYKKEKQKEYLESLALAVDPRIMGANAHKVGVVTDKILEVFENSEFETFDLFFNDFERRYFEHACTKSARVQALKSEHLSLCRGDVFGEYSNYNYDIPSEYENSYLKRRTSEEIQELWKTRELTFDALYMVVSEWNTFFYYNQNKFEEKYNYDIAYNLLAEFAAEVAKEVLTPEWADNISYVSSSRVDIRRLYTLENRDDFSQMLREYFKKRHQLDDYERVRADRFINEWIRRFGIGHSISLDVDDEGLGVQIRLHKTVDDKKGRLLADEGYGVTQLFSILLQIETVLLGAHYHPSNAAQYERLVELHNGDFPYTFREWEEFGREDGCMGHTIIIEEPEIHLHPKYQSMLADMLLDAYLNYNIHFIIETHSEYLIRKTQVMVANKNYKDEEELKKESPFMVYYIDGRNRDLPVYAMGYKISGGFENKFGEGFFDEAAKLDMTIIRKEFELKKKAKI